MLLENKGEEGILTRQRPYSRPTVKDTIKRRIVSFVK